jgi:hypothetical protein
MERNVMETRKNRLIGLGGLVGKRLGMPAFAAAALMFSLGSAPAARAAGVVSTCDQGHLQTALNGGGLVTFACSGSIGVVAMAVGAPALIITSNTTIDGTGYNVAIDGIYDQVFVVNSGVTLALKNLTIANGYAAAGAGVYNDGGTLIVTNCTFSANNAISLTGGAIWNAGTAMITNSTLSGNIASKGFGGGISNGGTLTVTNSTFYNNSANQGGGAIYNYGALTVTSGTFYNNGAGASVGGGIIWSDFATAKLENTIVVNSNIRDCVGAITDGGYNLDDDGSCGFTSANHSFSNDTSVTFTSTAPQSNGGPTATLALHYTTSPANHAIGAIPAGTNGCATSIAIDERSVTRPGSVNGNCSMGAYEYVSGTSASDGVKVTTITDCTDDSKIQSAVSTGGRIVFACSGDIPLTKTLAIGENTTIDVTGQIVTLDGQHSVEVLSVGAATLSLNNLTIANGSGNFSGGGVYSSGGTLVVTNSSFSGNSAFMGGGIFSSGTLIVTNSMFSGNSAGYGAGIEVESATLTVTNSTFSANSASADAGGILNNSGVLTVTSSTFSGNSASVVGGGISNFGTATLENTVIANSPSGGDCYGTPTDNGYNVDDDGSCGFSSANHSFSDSSAAKLGSLSNNGGPTLTVPLNTGSVALGAIPLGTNGCGTITTDQRGVFRPQQGAQAAACDIGALQTAQNQVQVTFESINSQEVPIATPYYVGPLSYTGRQTLTLPIGTQSTVWAPSPQPLGAGTEYGFQNWSDKGAEAHLVTISSSNIAYTAKFHRLYLLTTAVSPSGAGTVSPTTGSYYAAGAIVPITATPKSKYGFSNWTGNVANAKSASTTVTMTSPQTVTANFRQLPIGVSVTPAHGSGAAQAFTAVYSDASGASDLEEVRMLINSSRVASGSCYVRYVTSSAQLQLRNDAGNAWSTGLTPGGSGTVSNSQCTLSAAGSSVTASGNKLTVVFKISFLSSFGGTKDIWLYAVNNEAQHGGFNLAGTFDVL